MSRFYRSSWFPYVTPFLIFLALDEAKTYIPHWHHHLNLAQVFLCGGLLWMWKKHFWQDITASISKPQLWSALTVGLTAFALWPLAESFDIVTLTSAETITSWPPLLTLFVNGCSTIGFVLIFPILNELFWRSFMLRYFIAADFLAVQLGTFQLFSFVAVVGLSALPSNYILLPFLNSLLFSLLLIWQKNLRCCIVAHILCNTLLASYLLINGYTLF